MSSNFHRFNSHKSEVLQLSTHHLFSNAFCTAISAGGTCWVSQTPIYIFSSNEKQSIAANLCHHIKASYYHVWDENRLKLRSPCTHAKFPILTVTLNNSSHFFPFSRNKWKKVQRQHYSRSPFIRAEILQFLSVFHYLFI